MCDCNMDILCEIDILIETCCVIAYTIYKYNLTKVCPKNIPEDDIRKSNIVKYQNLICTLCIACKSSHGAKKIFIKLCVYHIRMSVNVAHVQVHKFEKLWMVVN